MHEKCFVSSCVFCVIRKIVLLIFLVLCGEAFSLRSIWADIQRLSQTDDHHAVREDEQKEKFDNCKASRESERLVKQIDKNWILVVSM